MHKEKNWKKMNDPRNPYNRTGDQIGGSGVVRGHGQGQAQGQGQREGEERDLFGGLDGYVVPSPSKSYILYY